MRATLFVLLGVVASWRRLPAQDTTRLAEAQTVLSSLVESYGVSGSEGPVRDAVTRLLPAWAQPQTDTAGNLWVLRLTGRPLAELADPATSVPIVVPQ